MTKQANIGSKTKVSPTVGNYRELDHWDRVGSNDLATAQDAFVCLVNIWRMGAMVWCDPSTRFHEVLMWRGEQVTIKMLEAFVTCIGGEQVMHPRLIRLLQQKREAEQVQQVLEVVSIIADGKLPQQLFGGAAKPAKKAGGQAKRAKAGRRHWSELKGGFAELGDAMGLDPTEVVEEPQAVAA